jgi:pimeloyl-ACP methyl ester carboxylesterase
MVSTLKLAHGRVRFEVLGPESGEGVLLVHGLTYPLEVWAGLVPHLVSQGFRVCRYDLYGRGEAEFDGTPLTLSCLAQQAVEVIDAASFRSPVSLVSLSNADLILAQVAQLVPGRVRHLVCLAPSCWDSRTMNIAARYSAWPWLVGTRTRVRAHSRMLQHRTHLPENSAEEIKSAYVSAIRTVLENPAFARAVLSQIRHMPSFPQARALLRDLPRHLPISLINFRAEQDSTKSGLELWTENVPHARQEWLEGTHMGLLEHPASVAAAVARALGNTK